MTLSRNIVPHLTQPENPFCSLNTGRATWCETNGLKNVVSNVSRVAQFSTANISMVMKSRVLFGF